MCLRLRIVSSAGPRTLTSGFSVCCSVTCSASTSMVVVVTVVLSGRSRQCLSLWQSGIGDTATSKTCKDVGSVSSLASAVPGVASCGCLCSIGCRCRSQNGVQHLPAILLFFRHSAASKGEKPLSVCRPNDGNRMSFLLRCVHASVRLFVRPSIRLYLSISERLRKERAGGFHL